MGGRPSVTKRFFRGAALVWLGLVSIDAVYTVLHARSDAHYAPEIGPFYAFILFALIFSIPYFCVVGVVTGILALTSKPTPIPGLCPSCRYDLTGNVSGVCPECGTPASPAAAGAGERAGTPASEGGAATGA